MAQQYMEVYSCQGCSNVDDDDMVQCDSCNGWYHYICAGPDITDDVANYDWNCEGCVKYQFSLTLKNKSSDESCKDDNQDSASSECVTSHKDLALDYLEAKKMLDEEQMNKSFEIQRRFLRERFNILRLSDNPVTKQSENVRACLDKQAQISSKHTRFNMDDVAEFIPGSSTPMRTPSTIIESINNEVEKQRVQSLTTSCQNKDLFMSKIFEPQSTDLQYTSARDKQMDQLFETTSKFDYQQKTSPSQPVKQMALPEYMTAGATAPDNATSESKFPMFTSKNDLPFIPFSDRSKKPWPPNWPYNSQAVSDQIEAVKKDSTVLNANQIAARHILPKDLPKFNGTPRDWPMFISSYESSTTTGGYSSSENLIRLQRSLQGKAMDSVRSILLSPENVPKVIEILRMKYGRPEVLIHFLIEEIRDEPPPKMEKLESIINFALTVKNLCSTIEVTKVEAHLNNPYLMQEIVEKLPSSMKLEWSKMKRSLPNVNLITLGDWLYEVAQAASEVVTPCVVPKDKGKNNNNNKKDDNRNKNDRYYVASHKDSDISAISKNSSFNFVPSKCKVCLQTCTKVSNCKKFQNMSVDERWNEVRDKKLCSTCLKSHRRFQCKDKKKCKEIGCGAWHDIMLHKEPVQTSAVHYGLSFSHTVIYRVIPVILYGPSRKIHTYAFLDGGSGITLLEDNLAEYLGIQGEKVSLHLKWTSKIQRSEPDSQRVGLQISDVFGTERYEMNNVRTVRSLELPQQSISKELLEHYSHLDNIPIQTYDKAVSRILIGLENINLMVSLQTAEGKWKEPVATKTRLGWVLQGGPQFYNGNSVHCLPMREGQNDSDLHQLVKNFYSLESFGVRIPEKVIESKQAERSRQIMESTTFILQGRSESGLLWKLDEMNFPDSKAMAMKRLESLERRMLKDKMLASNMNAHLADYQAKNYTRRLSQEEIDVDSGRNWYLPIFPAYDPKKPEKFRIVWDAAAEVKGVSLNSHLLTGPDLLVPLPDILYRFREKAIAVDGDIKEMFHQIEVRKEDQNAQRFLWRGGEQDKSPEVFVMQRLTFGATCSPSISQFVKDTNAKRYSGQFPEAVNTIIHNHYVDNMIDCTHTVEEAVILAKNVKFIHQQAGFELCKFRSNSKEVLQQLGVKTEREEVNLSFNSDIERILGMFWKTSMDTFTYSLRFTKLSKGFLNGDKRPTKREVLRTLMTIFDPLGLLAFFLIYAKILLQEIWTSNIGWDDQLTDIQFVKWTTWIEILPEIEKLQIPRLYSRKLSPVEPKSIELHVFVDASELAYAAVAYLRIENDEGVQCVLVGSKTRVAPLKPISIPRLELQAGVLGARYMKYLSKVHTLKINRRVIWTDSRVLLQWLHSEARKYRQFVAFRVGEILELTNIDEWRWVATKDNVADEATKWSKTPVMSTTNRWFNGPDFLREHNNWDMDWSTFEYEENDEEIRLITSHQELLPPEIPNPDRFSKWERILRAQAYVIRAVYNVETIFKFPMSIPLTSEELSLAEKSLFRRAQFDGFGEELAIMQWNKSNSSENPRYVEASSLIAKCSPYLDDEQLIRVHGRIDVMSILNLDTRRPIILPRNHKVSELMIDWYHRRFHHANHETVINEIKQRFYIPRVRVALKSVVSKCQFCKNRRAQPMVPSMADLPAARLTPWTKVFTFTGIDYFGPLLITVKRSTEKRWGVLMTCLSTRAVHIEIVDSLDTESCILAIKDFMALYGHVTDLYCDNGTNFHGSENELRTEFQKMDPAAMHTRFTSPMTTWHFNPPAAAHMGGSWERLIRSIKTSLYHILQDRKPSYKVLKNVLRECQAIVNSRPLTFVAVNDVNAEALTPFHFLIGTSGGVVESCEIPAEEKFIRRNWITSQMLINQFWTRWVREYLPTITRRTRWFRDVKPVEVGDVVYIVDEKLERYSWPRGMVEEVFIGNNGQTRSAKVKVFNSDENKIKIYHRPVSKLAVLDVLTPTENQPSTVSQLENLSSIATPATVHQSTLPSPTLQLPMLDQEGGSGLLSNGITNGENVDDAP